MILGNSKSCCGAQVSKVLVCGYLKGLTNFGRNHDLIVDFMLSIVFAIFGSQMDNLLIL